jgi:aflatoxin B1 aldehyde reductase
MAPNSIPQLIFGAASFGDAFREPEDVQSVLELLKTYDVKYLDTAGRYPPTNPGRSEELIGLAKAAQQGFTIDSKILAGAGDGSGELTRESIERSVSASLDRLGIDKVRS